jgi:hypothetical protein
MRSFFSKKMQKELVIAADLGYTFPAGREKPATNLTTTDAMKIRLLVLRWNARLGFVDFEIDAATKDETIDKGTKKAEEILTQLKTPTHGRIVLPDRTQHLVIRPE